MHIYTCWIYPQVPKGSHLYKLYVRLNGKIHPQKSRKYQETLHFRY